jgi:hypothetical protein
MSNTENNSKTHTTHGETSWDESGSGGGGKVEFLRFSQNEAVFRVISKPFKYPVHKNVRAEGETKGRKFPCSKENGSCPLCDAGLEPKLQYMLGVIDRATGTYKVIDIGWGIFSQIKGYANSKIWGDPSRFDIMVMKNPASKGPADYYLCQPVPPSPLSIADQQIRDNIDLEYLRNKTSPPSPDTVEKLLAKFLNGKDLALPTQEEKVASVAAKTKTNGNGKKGTTVPPTELVDSGNLDEDFPNYDQPAN